MSSLSTQVHQTFVGIDDHHRPSSMVETIRPWIRAPCPLPLRPNGDAVFGVGLQFAGAIGRAAGVAGFALVAAERMLKNSSWGGSPVSADHYIMRRVLFRWGATPTH